MGIHTFKEMKTRSYQLSFHVKYALKISFFKVSQYLIVWIHHHFLINYLCVFNFTFPYTVYIAATSTHE